MTITLTAEELAFDIKPAIDNLTECQRQLDADGCEVGVSRQALDEVLAHHKAQAAEIERLTRAHEDASRERYMKGFSDGVKAASEDSVI